MSLANTSKLLVFKTKSGILQTSMIDLSEYNAIYIFVEEEAVGNNTYSIKVCKDSMNTDSDTEVFEFSDASPMNYFISDSDTIPKDISRNDLELIKSTWATILLELIIDGLLLNNDVSMKVIGTDDIRDIIKASMNAIRLGVN